MMRSLGEQLAAFEWAYIDMLDKIDTLSAQEPSAMVVMRIMANEKEASIFAQGIEETQARIMRNRYEDDKRQRQRDALTDANEEAEYAGEWLAALA